MGAENGRKSSIYLLILRTVLEYETLDDGASFSGKKVFYKCLTLGWAFRWGGHGLGSWTGSFVAAAQGRAHEYRTEWDDICDGWSPKW